MGLKNWVIDSGYTFFTEICPKTLTHTKNPTHSFIFTINLCNSPHASVHKYWQGTSIGGEGHNIFTATHLSPLNLTSCLYLALTATTTLSLLLSPHMSNITLFYLSSIHLSYPFTIPIIVSNPGFCDTLYTGLTLKFVKLCFPIRTSIDAVLLIVCQNQKPALHPISVQIHYIG